MRFEVYAFYDHEGDYDPVKANHGRGSKVLKLIGTEKKIREFQQKHEI